MSNYNSTQYPTNTDTSANQQNIVVGSGGAGEPLDLSVKHHVHRENEPLPGARGGAHTIDYNPQAIENTKLPPSEEGDTQDLTPHHHNVSGHATSQGLLDNVHRENRPEGHGVPIQHIPSQHHSSQSGSFPASNVSEKSFDIHGNEITTPRHILGQSISENDDDPLGYGRFGGVRRGPNVDVNNLETTGNGVTTSSQDKPHTESTTPPVTHFKHDVNLNEENEHNAPQRREKPSIGDKIVGKTQQLAGKLTHNEDLQDKGEVRKKGGPVD